MTSPDQSLEQSLTSRSEAPPSLSASVRPPAKSFWRRHGLKLAASTIITGGIIYTLARGKYDWVPSESSQWANVRWWTLPAYVLTVIAMSYFRAIRWRHLLRSIADIPQKRILTVSWIGFAAILLMPFRIGEVVRPYMIREKGKVSLAAATSSVVAERIIDGLYLSIVLALAFILVPTAQPMPEYVLGLPPEFSPTVAQVRGAGWAMLGVFAAAFVTIAIFYVARGFARKVTFFIVAPFSKSLAEKLASLFEKFANGLAFLGRGKDAWWFFVETTLYWGLNALGMWLLAWGCGIVHADGTPITFGETCGMMGVLGVTILIPGPPALIGLFQLGLCAGMTMYFPKGVIESQGMVYVLLCFGIQLVWTAFSGGYLLLRDRKNLRALEEAEGILPPASVDIAST